MNSERWPSASGPPRTLVVVEGQEGPHDEEQADPEGDGKPCRPEREHEVGDDRWAGLRSRVHRLDADDGAQRPVEQPQSRRRHDRDRRRGPGEQPGAARGSMPQLGDEVGERHHHERQRRVVVVLEGGAVDAGPRDPLGREPDRDERQSEAPTLERHPRHEPDRGDPQPPDDETPGIVESSGGAGCQPLLVEPDRLEVHRPRPPRRGGRVGRRQAVVIAVHRAGQVEEGLACVARRPARDELVVFDQSPRDVADDVDPERHDDHADGHPDDRKAQQPARPKPVVGRLARRIEQADRVVRRRRGASGPKPQRPANQNDPATMIDPNANAMATSNGVTDRAPRVTAVSSLPAASAPKKTMAPAPPAPRRRSGPPRRSRRWSGPPR